MTLPEDQPLAYQTHQRDVLGIARQMGLCGTFVKIGAFGGQFSEQIMLICQPQKLYCLDPYESYEDFRNAVNFGKQTNAASVAKERLLPFGDRVEFLRMYSTHAARNFADQSLDFIYIGGTHQYDCALEDFGNWYPKVRDGGLICGNDANLWTNESDPKKNSSENLPHRGVLKAACDFADRHHIKLYQVGTQCLIFKGCDFVGSPGTYIPG